MRLASFKRTVAAAALVFEVCGCGYPRRHAPNIAVISLTGGESCWVAYQHAIEKRAAAYGYTVSVAAPQSEMDYKTQAEMVQQAIDHHADGIIVSPQHQSVLASVLFSAHQAGIPVVVAGMTVALEPNDYAASIQLDNRDMGVLAANEIIHLLHGTGRVAIIGVSPTLEVTSAREQALVQQIKAHSRIEVAPTKYGLSDWARSRQATLDALEEAPPGHPVAAIFTSDEFSTLGALGALRLLKHRPVFVGVGQESDTVHALMTGKIDGLLADSPQKLGSDAIETMHAVLEHHRYNRNQIEPVQLIDSSDKFSVP